MKKIIAFILVFFCCQVTFAEKALIDHIVYYLDLKSLTARVLNFQTSKTDLCDITIPSTVEYKHDTYTVTILSYERFTWDSEFYYDYEKARMNIEHVILPNTIKEVWYQAFCGMTRLREIEIPESVTLIYVRNYGGGLFGNFAKHTLGVKLEDELPRLERIVVNGTPDCLWDKMDGSTKYTFTSRWDYRNREWTETPYNLASYNYILQVAYTMAGINSLDSLSCDLCPNLRTFSMPDAERKIGPIKQCYSELRMLCNSYNAQLKENPYYDGFKITYNLTYKGNLHQLRRECDSIKAAITEQYNHLSKGQMENNMRENDLAKYITIYQTIHSECKQGIDSLRFEYRCESFSKQDSTILLFVEHKELPLSCRERQYQQHQNLFTDKVEFDAIYNSKQAESFQSEIDYRLELRPWLDKFIDLVKTNPDAKLQGMIKAKDGSIPYRIYSYLRNFAADYNTQDKRDHFYNEAVNAIFEYNVRVNEEYTKNEHFFKSRQEFVDAYITTEYKKILKTKK